VYTSPLIKASD